MALNGRIATCTRVMMTIGTSATCKLTTGSTSKRPATVFEVSYERLYKDSLIPFISPTTERASVDLDEIRYL